MAQRWLTIKGAMDGPAFAACVEHLLVPEPTPGTVVIPDNLATHRNAAAARAMRDAGCWCLPPCRPDLSPVQINRALSRPHGVRPLIFPKLKPHL